MRTKYDCMRSLIIASSTDNGFTMLDMLGTDWVGGVSEAYKLAKEVCKNEGWSITYHKIIRKTP